MSVSAHMLHAMLVARRFATVEAKDSVLTSAELQRLILEDARHKLEQCIRHRLLLDSIN